MSPLKVFHESHSFSQLAETAENESWLPKRKEQNMTHCVADELVDHLVEAGVKRIYGI